MKLVALPMAFMVAGTQVSANPLPTPTDKPAVDGPITDDMFTDFGGHIPEDMLKSFAVPSFTGPFGPNGETMTLNGTIEEVVTQVAEINPNYDWDQPTDHDDHDHNNMNKRQAEFGHIWPGAKEDDWLDVMDIKCTNKGIIGGFKDPINQGLHRLRTVDGWTNLETGMECKRVSCSYSSALFMCYEPRRFATVRIPWRYVGEMGAVLRDKCIEGDHVKGKLWAYTGMILYPNYSYC